MSGQKAVLVSLKEVSPLCLHLLGWNFSHVTMGCKGSWGILSYLPLSNHSPSWKSGILLQRKKLKKDVGWAAGCLGHASQSDLLVLSCFLPWHFVSSLQPHDRNKTHSFVGFLAHICILCSPRKGACLFRADVYTK